MHELSPVSYELARLERNDVEAYLDHRLINAGYNGSNLFTHKAVDLISRSSNGIPRLINIIAHKALTVAFGKRDYALTDKHIKLALKTYIPYSKKSYELPASSQLSAGLDPQNFSTNLTLYAVDSCAQLVVSKPSNLIITLLKLIRKLDYVPRTLAAT